MPHKLAKRHHLHAVGHNPLVASLRYRCECAANEVLTINMVLDQHCDEEQFVWTMRQMWRDLQFEVEQHIRGAAAKDDAHPLERSGAGR